MSEMLITFGLQLDGQRASKAYNRLGTLTVGPQGLLDILETQLGLTASRPHVAERTAAFRDCLADRDNAQRFYHASFEADELGVAATLLAWRDDLYLHGWKGQVGVHANRRLKDLAEVEVKASERVAPSTGQRLQRLAEALPLRRPPIEIIRLVDEWDILPLAWRNVLRLLPTQPLAELPGSSQGFLGQLQTQLRKSISGQPITPIPWQEDGTVKVVQAQSRVLAASWLSRSLSNGRQTLLVATAEGPCLDAHMVGANQARHGLNGHSDLRPALQVLPLAMELLWAPMNYPALLQFLTHPICPIRPFARRQLAAKVSTMPGVNGAQWDAALARISEHYGADALRVETSIQDWLGATAFSPDEGAPLTHLISRCERLLAFFQTRLGLENVAQSLAARAGHAQCEAALRSLQTLQSQGIERLRPRQLHQVIEQATASGTDNPLLAAQVGAHLTVSHPGAVIEQSDSVLWWSLAMPPLPNASPWSNAERLQLKEVGVELLETAAQLAQTAHDWLRPVLAATQQLTLVLPPPQEELHPLWQMIEAVTKRPKTHVLEDLLHGPSGVSQQHPHIPLPVRKRWWKLPSDTPIRAPEQASFSSLNLLLFNPYQWLLQYGANIHASKSLTLSDGFLLSGSLAHRLAERFFSQPDALSKDAAAFDAWFATHFNRVVEEEGAVLLMRGRGADLTTLRHRTHRAIKQLRQHFTAASVSSISPEKPLLGEFVGGALGGSADLVLTTENGHRAIVDMKWAGGKKYPQLLKANRHLQLAVYAQLLRQDTGSWPSVAYFILESARLLAPDDRAFADAEQIPSNPPGSLPELWERFIETWKWRQAQVAAGTFEIALESIEEDEASIPPEEAIPMEYLKEAYNEYLVLAGWEQ